LTKIIKYGDNLYGKEVFNLSPCKRRELEMPLLADLDEKKDWSPDGLIYVHLSSVVYTIHCG
jgi:hypothetical protein